jgi:hypothetical protein
MPKTYKFASSNKKRRTVAYDGAEDDSSAGSSPEEEEHVTIYNTGKATPQKKSGTLRSITLSDDDSGVESPLQSPTKVRVTRGRALMPRNESPDDTDKPKIADTRSLISGGTVNFSRKSKRTPQSRATKQMGGSSALSGKETVREDNSSTQSNDEDAIAVLPTRQRIGGHGTRKKQIIVTDDDSEDVDMKLQGSQRRSGWPLNSTQEDVSEDELPSLSQMKYSSGRAGMVAHNLEDDEEEEVVVMRSSARRKFQKRAEKDNEEHDAEEDDEDPISSPLKRRRTVIEDDSESDPFTSPSKRFHPGPIGQKKVESVAKRPTKRITRQQHQRTTHRTAREKKLELLRRQRAGERITELTSSESDAEEPQHGIYDSNSDLEVLSEFDDEEKDEDEGMEEVRHSLFQSNKTDNDDDFVVEDDDVPLGVPDNILHDIPLQFTHHAHKPLKEHFKDVVEWMIQNKVIQGPENICIYLITRRSTQRLIEKTLSMFKPLENLTWRFKVMLRQCIAHPYGRKILLVLSGPVQCSKKVSYRQAVNMKEVNVTPVAEQIILRPLSCSSRARLTTKIPLMKWIMTTVTAMTKITMMMTMPTVQQV